MVAIPAFKRRKFAPTSDEDSSPSTLIENIPVAPSVFYEQASKWNLEQDYETRPRNQKKKEKENSRLPIKTAEGRVEQLQLPDTSGDDEDSYLQSEDEATEFIQPQVDVQEEAAEIPLQQQIIEAKEELARLANLINENPEEHAGAFKALGQLTASSIPTIRKLGLVTQLAVYKDVIPGYRIRPLGENDSLEKVSKEVRRVRTFEQSLVSSYHTYVKELFRCAKPKKVSDERDASIAQVATSCACTLLLAVPHFNFRDQLLKILIDRLSNKKIDSNFIKCRETLETLFRDDEDGTPSLDAVTLLTKMMKARDYRFDESVLNTFLHLRLLSEFSSKASQNKVDKPTADDRASGKKPKQKREFRTKKQRKMLKEQKVVEKEFREADAIVSHEERDRMQAETLKLVFVAYFRILKSRSPSLMGAVLEGLAKYAHLINQDFFGDVLEALKDLINETETSKTGSEDISEETPSKPTVSIEKTRSTLLCINTAFALLAGQDVSKAASSLSLDLSFFTSHLYKSLYSLALDPNIEFSLKSLHLPDPHGSNTHQNDVQAGNNMKVNLRTTASLLHSSLACALTPRSTPPLRVAAFTKQLYTSLLQTPEKSSIALLALFNQLFKLHGRRIASLWNTEERKGDGVFDPWKADMEGSNPFASTIWEGELLKLHFAKRVREGTADCERTVRGLG